MEKLITIEIVRHYWGTTSSHLIRVPENMKWSKRKSDNSDYYNYYGVGCHTNWESRRLEAMHDYQVIDAHCFDNTTWVCLKDIERHPYLDARCVESVDNDDPGDLCNDVWVEIAEGRSIVAAMKILKVSHPLCALTMVIKTGYTDFKGRTFSMENDTRDLTQLVSYDSLEMYNRGTQWIKCDRVKGQKVWLELARCVHAKMMQIPYKPNIKLDVKLKQIPAKIISGSDSEMAIQEIEHLCIESKFAQDEFLSQFR